MFDSERLLIDNKTLDLVRSYVPGEDALAAMSDFFSALGDGTRLKLISALSITEMCVTDLSLSLKINQTTVSHQLRNLKSIGAVKVRRQGKVSFYSLKDNSLLDIMLKAVNFVS
ncbi:MAG: winged helix-turn-helix transcriptional regulator [Clostridia bacterium]|jgi:ArsR family transcriptional regulator|uniref:ArsR/SmtB family transcription factor n=1 Tax=Pumilibacter muris TaxID=2941510 RepID=UPI00203EE3F9|nr:metalloregulator ArsR/SmtB family transcription factor [Pumilibacter muris]MCI8596658.1 winged helix-turn-helix transcriptional regulator [Clostridia bacterium]